MQVDVQKLRPWVSIVNPYRLPVRPPEVFEELGFPRVVVRKWIRRYPRRFLNNGKLGSASGVSDGVMLRILGEVIKADCSTGDAKLSKSNQVHASRDACLSRLDEMEAGEGQTARRIWKRSKGVWPAVCTSAGPSAVDIRKVLGARDIQNIATF